MKEINPETLGQFFKQFEETRKSLPSIRKVEKEAGIKSQGYLNKIISGEQPLTDETIAKLLPVLKKYNF